MRDAIDTSISAEVAGRFMKVLEKLPEKNLASISRMLGYKHPTTIYAIKKKGKMPGIERLKKLADQRAEDGSRPNIDWIVTGKGEAFIKKDKNKKEFIPESLELLAIKKLLKKQSQDKLKAVLTLLR